MTLNAVYKLKGVSFFNFGASKYLFPVGFSWLPSHCYHFHQRGSNVKASLIFGQNKKVKYVGSRALSSHVSYDLDGKLQQSELVDFMAVRDVVYNALIEGENKSLADALNWHSKVFDYNLKGGKKNRGTTVVTTYKALSNKLTDEGLLQASLLGWCVEMLQSFFVVADDIMDNSSYRRGEPCWYKKPEVGMIAINDSLLLQCGIYKILRKFFEKNKFYNRIVEEFLQTTEKTVYGQCLDMLSNPPQGKPRYEFFTKERYNAIVEYKTSYYTFCLPIHLAMHLIGDKTDEEFKVTRDISLKLGLLFQIQDDFLDCYGDPKITGKLGTDIVEGKCSWFAVTFLEIAGDSDKKEWMENYGTSNERSVSKVMGLYEKLNMFDKYMNFEHELHSEIDSLIKKELKNKSMQELFSNLLNKMYKRKK